MCKFYCRATESAKEGRRQPADAEATVRPPVDASVSRERLFLWLDDKYRQPLLDLGIAAASDLKDVVEEDLDSMGMTKLEKRRFLAAVSEL